MKYDREALRENRDGLLQEAYNRAEGNRRRLVTLTGVPSATLGRWLKTHNISRRTHNGMGEYQGEPPGASIDGDKATLTSRGNPTGTNTLTPEELLREHGLDPADWIYSEPKINRWDALTGGGGVTTLSQITIYCKRKPDVRLLSPPTPEPLPVPKAPPPRERDYELIAITSDDHHPRQNRALDEAFCMWLADNLPDRHESLGDGQNNSRFGRHGKNPAYDDDPNQSLDAEVQSWYRRICASPDTKHRRWPGNHDKWLEKYQLQNAAALMGIRPGQLEQERADGMEPPPVLSLRSLLRADEFGIELVDAPGEYHDARVQIAPGLVAVHGTKTGRQGAYKAALRMTTSHMQGHDHKQSLEYITRYDENHDADVVVTVSVGSMCDLLLGYDDTPDNQQGFATATVWPDGRFHVELAAWIDGELLWRDRRYKP